MPSDYIIHKSNKKQSFKIINYISEKRIFSIGIKNNKEWKKFIRKIRGAQKKKSIKI